MENEKVAIPKICPHGTGCVSGDPSDRTSAPAKRTEGCRGARRNRVDARDPGFNHNEACDRVKSFPSLKKELRVKSRLKKNNNERLTDDAVEANSRKIAKKWGAAAAVSEPTVEPATKVVSIRGYVPDYLDHELAMRAAQQRVTKTFLILEALAKAGYRVEDSRHDPRPEETQGIEG